MVALSQATDFVSEQQSYHFVIPVSECFVKWIITKLVLLLFCIVKDSLGLWIKEIFAQDKPQYQVLITNDCCHEW